MTKKRLAGLDELMIVNPGLPNMGRELPMSQVFLGEDGALYRLDGLQAENSLGELAEFYLGEDGTLYRLERFDPTHESHFGEAGTSDRCYFLGEDGTLYETFRS